VKNKIIYQFKIELLDIEPAIWRLIEVPSEYSFWDLHVAIQDSMGWFDCHLHSYKIYSPLSKSSIEIGIPDGDFDTSVLPGWDVPISQFFKEPGNEVSYDYDFGDGWSHRITLIGMYLKQNKKKLPRCIDGNRACPPEDCGGVPGYYNLIEIISDPTNEEFEEMTSWLSNHVKNYYPYESDIFDAKKVKFSNPKTRFKRAFGG